MMRRQRSNFKAFSRLVTNIDVYAMMEKWEYDDALTVLKSRWEAIEDLHWDIEMELDGENPSYETEFTKYEKCYNQMKTTINTKMWSVSHREKSTHRMEIPSFYVSYQQWTTFKDLFQEAIHKDPCSSRAQKQIYG